ncbi:MAG: RtcB family protein [Saezia sp.]
MTQENYIEKEVAKGIPLKMWVKGVPIEQEAEHQLTMTAQLPIVFKHIAAMPDVHSGKGSTIGSVIPTIGAIIPAAVGVDIGCGMMACRTSLHQDDLPRKNWPALREMIEKYVPHGRNPNRRGRDYGAWENPPAIVNKAWATLEPEFEALSEKYPRLKKTNNHKHLGTLGTGNHFLEVCFDEQGYVWLMLHSGSRGIGNAIGDMFIKLAQDEAQANELELPHRDLAYFDESSPYFDDYVRGVNWAQKFAQLNREVMMQRTIEALQEFLEKPFEAYLEEAINCHHNYVQKEHHFGEDVYVTRKGAVSAKAGEMGIIPGSMGERSFIVRGKGNPESFTSCSHGAGRIMSRTAAKKTFTLEDHKAATSGVECRKDMAVLDETPKAYKDIDAVMAAQTDLVEIMHTLKQIICIKG